MNTKTTIRMAGPSDAPSIYRLLVQLQGLLGVESASEEEFRLRFEAMLAEPRYRVFVAEEGGELRGFITIWLRESLFHGGPVALVDELVVAEGARGRGIGSRLLQRALDFCRQRGCVEVEVTTEADNRSARRFYARHGFREQGLLLEAEL